MNSQATLECMQKMKLDGMAASYEAIIHLPADAHPDTHECIATLVDAELQSRSHKKTNMLLRLSRLRYQSSIQDIIYSDERNLYKQTVSREENFLRVLPLPVRFYRSCLLKYIHQKKLLPGFNCGRL